jgi:hypothetical protein
MDRRLTQSIRKILSSEVAMISHCSREIVAKATRNDPMGKPGVVPSRCVLANCRRDVVPIVASEFADCAIDSHCSVGDKVVHQIPDVVVCVDTCQ